MNGFSVWPFLVPVAGLGLGVMVAGYAATKGELSEKLAMRRGAAVASKHDAVRKAPHWLPAGSCQVDIPASSIHVATSSLAALCCGERCTRSDTLSPPIHCAVYPLTPPTSPASSTRWEARSWPSATRTAVR